MFQLDRFIDKVLQYKCEIEHNNYHYSRLGFVEKYIFMYRSAAKALISIISKRQSLCVFNYELGSESRGGKGRICLHDEKYKYQRQHFINWSLWRKYFTEYKKQLRSGTWSNSKNIQSFFDFWFSRINTEGRFRFRVLMSFPGYNQQLLFFCLQWLLSVEYKYG